METDNLEPANSRGRMARLVFVVDPHPLMRDQIAHIVERLPEFEFCGGAGDKTEAMAQMEKLQPDVVITEIALGPGRNGLELTKDVMARFPGTDVIIFSLYDEMLYAERSLRAGAKAYICKTEPGETLVRALESTVQRGFYVSNQLSERIVAQFVQGTRPRKERGVDALSDRELEVFQLIGRGRSTREIAAELNLETKTVETYRARIKKKLQITSNTELYRNSLEMCQPGRLTSLA